MDHHTYRLQPGNEENENHTEIPALCVGIPIENWYCESLFHSGCLTKIGGTE
jgi:hypothetical protein